MEEILEQLNGHLAQKNVQAAQKLIDNIIAEYEWKDIVEMLKTVTTSLYKKHLLKTHNAVLSIFNLQEFLGIDCDIFSEIAAIPQPKELDLASELLFEHLLHIATNQLKGGGSTLFFNVEKIRETKSVVLISDLIKARYRETVFILAEIDERLQTLTTDWINVARLWRIGYGFRILKARNHGMLIHVREYKEIRNSILKQLGINPDRILEERDKLIQRGESAYLQMSDALDNFILSYITSLGIRGKFEPQYKPLKDHEGFDEF